MNKKTIAVAILGLLRLAGAAKDETVSEEASSLFFVKKGNYWVKRAKFDADSTCSEGRVTTTNYFRLSSLCSSFDALGGVEGYVKYSCYTDPTGLTDGISITASYYDNDECLGDKESIVSQSGFFLPNLHTECNTDTADFFGDDATLSGSEIFDCLFIEDDQQLPFKTDDENTYVKVGFENSACTLHVSNVLDAEINHINQCETIDVEAAYGGDADFAGINSRRVSDCGYQVQYFTDEHCQDRKSSLTVAWVSDGDFDECSSATAPIACVEQFGACVETSECCSGFACVELTATWACRQDRRLQFEGEPSSSSSRSFCASGDYGPYATGDKKLAGSVSVSSETAESSFAQSMKDILRDNTYFSSASDLSSSTSLPQEDQMSPMNYVYLGAFSFFSALAGAVLAAKFIKPKAQFDGVEMQSDHSSL